MTKQWENGSSYIILKNHRIIFLLSCRGCISLCHRDFDNILWVIIGKLQFVSIITLICCIIGNKRVGKWIQIHKKQINNAIIFSVFQRWILLSHITCDIWLQTFIDQNMLISISNYSDSVSWWTKKANLFTYKNMKNHHNCFTILWMMYIFSPWSL